MYGRSIADTAHCTCPGQWQMNEIKEKEKPAISSPRPLPQLATPSRLRTGSWDSTMSTSMCLSVSLSIFAC